MGLIHIVNVVVTFHHLGLHPLNPIEQPGYSFFLVFGYLFKFIGPYNAFYMSESIHYSSCFVGSTPNVSILEPKKKNSSLVPNEEKDGFFFIFSHQILLN
jgi:hypothetical protein